ncbi:MAG: hypothetical protein ACREOP_05810 [Thermodesulfobacteriota bacterium]
MKNSLKFSLALAIIALFVAALCTLEHFIAGNVWGAFFSLTMGAGIACTFAQSKTLPINQS